MKVYCISLPERSDRREKFDALWSHMLDYEYVDGIRASPPEEIASAWSTCKDSAYGCYLAHTQLWARLDDDDTLILEDDALPHSDVSIYKALNLISSLPSDWDMFYLGGQHEFSARPQGTSGIVQCVKTHRTHAYVVRGGVGPGLSARLEGAGHIDRQLANAIYASDIIAYAVTPWGVGQFAGMSDVTGVEANERWWAK